MTTTSTAKESTFFRLLDIHISEIKNYPNAIQDMVFNRSYEGMIIRDVFPKDVMEQVVERLEKNEGDINSLFFSSEKEMNFENFKGPHLFGKSLLFTKPDSLKEYFAYTPAFRQACRLLFQGKLDYEEHLESVFQSISGGVPVKIPTGSEGESYCPSVIRVLPDGHEIIIHVGNSFVEYPQIDHLKSIFDLTDQLSFFIPLSLPEAGGQLVIYALEWEEAKRGGKFDLQTLGLELQDLNIDEYETLTLTPGVGDMLLFDGGRFYHSVNRVSGSRPRRTIGGFLNFSCERDTVYYWE